MMNASNPLAYLAETIKTKKTKNKQTKKKLNHNSIIMMNFYQLYYHNEKL